MKHKAQSVALTGVCVALALGLSYLEVILPPIVAAVPGVKIGLANVVVLVLLYRFGVWRAALVSALRILLMFLLFGNVLSLLYSVAGATLSIALMFALKQTGLFSRVVVSSLGGVAHNVGQILMAILLLGVAEMGYYLIVLAITGCVFGAVVGLIPMPTVRVYFTTPRQ